MFTLDYWYKHGLVNGFLHDQLSDGLKYRLFNAIDNFKREGLSGRGI